MATTGRISVKGETVIRINSIIPKYWNEERMTYDKFINAILDFYEINKFSLDDVMKRRVLV